MQQLLLDAARRGASDVHLAAGYGTTVRQHGELQVIDEHCLSGAEIEARLKTLCPDNKWAEFLQRFDVDFSLQLTDGETVHRFRVNYFRNSGTYGACFRIIPDVIPSFGWAGFPEALASRLISFRNGLVIVTGVTGSGKTTTLAMCIDKLCREGRQRIVTIEDPVEYLFGSTTGSLITQREIGMDVGGFGDGLRFALRQDPDVILVGEIRDRETAQMALSAAETGHMVFTTMHTRDARGAITRYADLFPQAVQGDIRSQLAMSLRAVISQHLVPCAQPGEKQALALEVLFNTLPVASAIRLGKIETIDNAIQTGRAEGMITLEESLRQLHMEGRITMETAEYFSKQGY